MCVVNDSTHISTIKKWGMSIPDKVQYLVTPRRKRRFQNEETHRVGTRGSKHVSFGVGYRFAPIANLIVQKHTGIFEFILFRAKPLKFFITGRKLRILQWSVVSPFVCFIREKPKIFSLITNKTEVPIITYSTHPTNHPSEYITPLSFSIYFFCSRSPTISSN